MKKGITTQLNEVAKTMPTIFEWDEEDVVFTGAEMNLTPFGEEEVFDKDKFYKVKMPLLRAVEHKQQIKDAYKRGGLIEVKKYHQQVINKFKKNDIRILSSCQ